MGFYRGLYKMAADEGAGQAARSTADGTVMPVGAPSLAREEISVLLVEDDEGDARLVEDELAERLPEGNNRAQSHACRRRSRHSRVQVDCVLLDLGLPDALGLDAVAQLRAHGAGDPADRPDRPRRRGGGRRGGRSGRAGLPRQGARRRRSARRARSTTRSAAAKRRRPSASCCSPRRRRARSRGWKKASPRAR